MINNTQHNLATTARLIVTIAAMLVAVTTPTVATFTPTATPVEGPPGGTEPLPSASTVGDVSRQNNSQLRLSSVTVNPGETAVVRLTADGANVAGYQANISFDPSVVHIVGVAGTDDFADPVANVNNEQGWVKLTQSSAKGVDDPVLARLRVSAVGSDGNTSQLSFVAEETSLNDVDRNSLDPTLVTGEVNVAAGDVTADETTTDTATDQTTTGTTDTATDQTTTGTTDTATDQTTTVGPESGDRTNTSNDQQAGSSGDDGDGLLGSPIVLVGSAVVLGGAVAAGVILGRRL
jgi:hypothetical protein